MNEDIEQVPLGRRKVDVVYPHPMTIRYETAATGVPETAALPPSRTLSGPGWSVTIETRRDGSLVLGNAETRLSRRRFTLADFPELRRFWSAVTAAAGVAIALDGGGAKP